MNETLLSHNDLDYYINNRYENYSTVVKMIIHHFENARKGFFDTLEFLNLWDCQHKYVFDRLHVHNNPEDVINYLQELPLTDEQKHVLYGFILSGACGCNPGLFMNRETRITFERIKGMFLEYPYDTPEKTYCTGDNFSKEREILRNIPPERFGDFEELYVWFKRRLKYKFAVGYLTIERRFDSWLIDNKCYAAAGTDEYKCYLTIDRFKQFIAEYPDIVAAEQKQSNTNVLQAKEDSNNGKTTGKSQRTINVEGLEIYFSALFKGMGHNTNYFSTMIDELKTDRTAKEFAQIAYMIYRSKKTSDRMPGTFNKWYKIFCENVNVPYVGGYKPNHLKNPNEALRKLFGYLDF
jgi:hypothetical protein